MPDRQFNVGGVQSAPADWLLPASLEIVPKTAYASFDGTGAAGTFKPCLRIISDSGHVAAEAVSDTQVAAGGSADCSWFRGLGGGGSFTPTPGTGVPPAGNLDGYIFNTSNQTITAIGHADRTNLLVQGNTITLDGVTSIRVEYYCVVASILNGVAGQGIGIELWDHYSATNVDKGTIGLLEVTQTASAGGPIYANASFSPAAGQHTYAIYGWKAVNASTAVISANTFIDGTGDIGPMWYRITVIPYDSSLPA